MEIVAIFLMTYFRPLSDLIHTHSMKFEKIVPISIVIDDFY